MSSHLVRTAQLRFAGARVITVVVVAIGALFLGMLVYILVGLVMSLPDIWNMHLAHQRGELGLADSFSYTMGLVILWLPVYIYGGLYVLPVILTLPVSAPIVALWQAPPRFLFLRPFNRGLLSRPLKRVARREVAPFGHLYTLSDADIKVSWYIRIPILLGQLALFSFRMRRIRDQKQIPRLSRAVDRTWLRNINWCMSIGKIFPVASSDDHWRRVVDCLLTRSSAVIIDVSDLRENVMWEIDRAKSLGVEARILYLISSDRVDASQAALTQALGAETCASRLFRYTEDGLAHRDRFRAALVEKVVGEATAENGRPRTHEPDRLDIAATVAFVLGLIPVLGLAFPNILGLPRWNPWEHSAYWPGIARVVNTEALTIMAFGLSTWVLLFLAARRAHTMRFLLIIQTLLLLSAPIGMLDW